MKILSYIIRKLRILIYFLGSYSQKFKINNAKYRFTDKNNHIFFGYYDISPFNLSDTILLACSVPINKSKNILPMKLGYFNLKLETPLFNEFAETYTWCWQMGARLRWDKQNEDYVYYNTLKENKFISLKKNIFNGQLIDEYPLSFYDISNDNKFGVTLDFTRLQRLRPGYGYSNFKDKSLNDKAPMNNGISMYNFITKKEKLLVSLFEISNIKPDDSMTNAEHYFNHLSFSPKSNYFLFFHLWFNNKKRYSRLFIYDMVSTKYYLISKNIVSHYSWRTENELLITETDKEGFKYRIYDLKNNINSIIGKNILTQDGHPSFSSYENIITDTYPNIFGKQKLISYDLSNQKIKQLASLYSPPEYSGEHKCDLHPRLSNKNNKICVDSSLAGKREIFIFNI